MRALKKLNYIYIEEKRMCQSSDNKPGGTKTERI